jgi:chaperonin GroEL
MSKELIFGEDARKKMLSGVKKLSAAVKCTLGPRGRIVIIKRQHGFHSTKDGITVAKSVILEDQFEDLGAQMVKEAADKTSQDAGDGTTSSTLLAESIFAEGLKLVEAGHSPTLLKQGMDLAVTAVVQSLNDMSNKVVSSKEIAQVGTISANGDAEVGNMIAEAMEKVGTSGIISLEESKGMSTELTVVNGYQFDRGYIAQHFMTNEKAECVLDNPYILLTGENINNSAVMLPIMEKCKDANLVPLFIVADGVDADALSVLVINKLRGSFLSCAVKAPGFGDRKKEMMQDIATLTGATVVSDAVGLKLEHFNVSVLGQAKKVVVTKNSTTIVEGRGDEEAIERRVAQIRSTMEDASDEFDKSKLQERLAKLVGGVAIISVGAATEAEMKEKKDRVEDALNATKAAVQEGIVPGGGVALLRAGKCLDSLVVSEELKYGVQIIKSISRATLKQIVTNAGKDASVVANKVYENEDPGFGYNAHTDTYENLIDAGVIDPTKVVRCSLQNAASVAGLMLTTECMITDKPEPPGKCPGK